MSRVPSVVARVLASSVLPTPGLALEQQRAAELEGEEDRRRERSVADVVGGPEAVDDPVDGPSLDGSLVVGRHDPQSTSHSRTERTARFDRNHWTSRR